MSVSVLAPHGIDNADISVLVSAYAPTGIAEKAAPAGLSSVRERVEARCRDWPDVKKYLVLGSQIAAAEKRVADADAAFERAKAAKQLLESNPELDLANKLREITERVSAAEGDKAAALADLALIRGFAPKLFCDAANVTRTFAASDAACHGVTLLGPKKEAQDALAAACKEAEPLIADVVAKVIAPAVEKFLIARKAADALGQADEFSEEVTRALLGAPPEGVAKHGGQFVVLAPAPAAPAVS